MAKQGRLLVLLLGGRIQPVITTALHFDPTDVCLICSGSEPRHIENATAMLARLAPRARILASRCVAPDDVGATRVAVRDMIALAPHLSPVVSVTSAPVPMTIGAFEAGRAAGPVYYRPAGASTLIDLTERTPPLQLAIKVSVENYMAICGLAKNRTHRQKLNPLEPLVYAAGRSLTGRPACVFDECHGSYGFLVRGAERELDFIGITGDLPLVVSCKTGKASFMKEHLNELATWGGMLGGRSCVLLYVTDQLAPEAGDRLRKRYEQFMQNARNMRIVVVTGDQLGQLKTILSKEQANPTYPRQ